MNVRRRHVLRFRHGYPEIRLMMGVWKRLSDPADIPVRHLGDRTFVVGEKRITAHSFSDLCSCLSIAVLNEASGPGRRLVALSEHESAVTEAEVLYSVSQWTEGRLRSSWPDEFWIVSDVMCE